MYDKIIMTAHQLNFHKYFTNKIIFYIKLGFIKFVIQVIMLPQKDYKKLMLFLKCLAEP